MAIGNLDLKINAEVIGAKDIKDLTTNFEELKRKIEENNKKSLESPIIQKKAEQAFQSLTNTISNIPKGFDSVQNSFFSFLDIYEKVNSQTKEGGFAAIKQAIFSPSGLIIGLGSVVALITSLAEAFKSTNQIIAETGKAFEDINKKTTDFIGQQNNLKANLFSTASEFNNYKNAMENVRQSLESLERTKAIEFLKRFRQGSVDSFKGLDDDSKKFVREIQLLSGELGGLGENAEKSLEKAKKYFQEGQFQAIASSETFKQYALAIQATGQKIDYVSLSQMIFGQTGSKALQSNTQLWNEFTKAVQSNIQVTQTQQNLQRTNTAAIQERANNWKTLQDFINEEQIKGLAKGDQEMIKYTEKVTDMYKKMGIEVSQTLSGEFFIVKAPKMDENTSREVFKSLSLASEEYTRIQEAEAQRKAALDPLFGTKENYLEWKNRMENEVPKGLGLVKDLNQDMTNTMGQAGTMMLSTMGQAYSDFFYNLTSGGKKAFSQYAHDFLKSLSMMAAQKGMFYLAEGTAMALIPGLQGNAGAMFAAAGLMFGVAAASGALAGSMSSAKSGGGGGGGAGSGAGGGGGGNTVEQRQTINIYGDVEKQDLEKMQKQQKYLQDQLLSRVN